MTTLDYLEKLLAFDTTSAHPNADLIAWVQAQLVAMGAKVQIIENAEGSKANLFATIGPGDRGGVMWRGDVVGSYGCGAGGGADLDRSRLRHDSQRRQSLWSRIGGYERICGRNVERSQKSGRSKSAHAVASGAVL